MWVRTMVLNSDRLDRLGRLDRLDRRPKKYICTICSVPGERCPCRPCLRGDRSFNQGIGLSVCLTCCRTTERVQSLFWSVGQSLKGWWNLLRNGPVQQPLKTEPWCCGQLWMSRLALSDTIRFRRFHDRFFQQAEVEPRRTLEDPRSWWDCHRPWSWSSD